MQFARQTRHPVVVLPPDAPTLDLSAPDAPPPPAWAIGRYDERRHLYTHELFGHGDERRDVHVGVDLFAPEGVAVHAFEEGVVEHAGVNPLPGDYGGVLVTRHELERGTLWVLLGHLSHASTRRTPVGSAFSRGAVLGWIGSQAENGGWPPHVHVQCSVSRPATHDMPGVVRLADRARALALYPDPRNLVLGPIYVDGRPTRDAPHRSSL